MGKSQKKPLEHGSKNKASFFICLELGVNTDNKLILKKTLATNLKQFEAMQSDTLGITTPPRLPIEITPCPILEAVLEIRFVAREDWSVIPGFLYSHIREKYGNKKDLPMSELPPEIRRKEPNFTHMPLISWENDEFLVYLGPRVVSLLTKPNNYPGWPVISKEMKWLIEKLKLAQFIEEGERLGLRYIDFFNFDIFDKLILKLFIGSNKVSGPEMSIEKVFRRGGLTGKLLLKNSVSVKMGNDVQLGSVLDLDLWVGPSDFELFQNGMSNFEKAHQQNKEIFFGLLKPEFLSTLSPKYPENL